MLFNISAIRCIVFTFLILASVLCFASPGRYSILNFGPEDYHAGIQNIDFAQNGDKTIFIANNLGVLSYNGNDWEIHSAGSGKKKRSLAFDDNKNRLYVGSQGEFGYYEGNWKYTSLNSLIPKEAMDFDEVWDVIVMESLVYFCAFERIYVFDGQEILTIETPEGFNRSFLSGGRLFVQSSSGKLWEISENKLETSFAQSIQNNIIAGIVPYEQGYLLIYNSGIIEYSTLQGSNVKFDNIQEALKGKYINHVLKLADNRLAISTQTSGLYLVDLASSEIEIIGMNEGLQSSACLRAFQDYTGNLWLGLQNGVSYVNINSSIRLIGQESGLFGSGYDAYQSDNGIYYSTSNGIYFLPSGKSKCNFLTGTEGPAYGITSISGNIYACHHKGLFLLNNEKAIKIAETEGLWKIERLKSNPKYVLGGTYSGLFLFEIDRNERLIPINSVKGFNESSRFFEEDDKGTIWVGQFYKGLYKLKLAKNGLSVTSKRIEGSESIQIDERILLAKIDDNIHVATREGIYLIDNVSDELIKAEIFEDIIGDQGVYLLRQDNQKNIHIYTDELIGFYRQISPNEYSFISSTLYPLDYSFNNDLLNISISTDGGVLYNANSGFIQYDPSLEYGSAAQSPLVISELYSFVQDSIIYKRSPFETLKYIPKNIVLSHKDRVLNFKVESFQFRTPQAQEFRYFLDGFDETVGPWVNSSSKEYTNLKEGSYELLVQTKDNVGGVITGEAFSFSVKPPLLRRIFTKFNIIILSIFILGILSYFQYRRFQKRVKLAETIKKRELELKQQEIVKIQTLKDQEIQQISEEKLNSDFVHVSNLLAASTMNLVVKNEFIESIKEQLNSVKSLGRNNETKKVLEQIVKDIDTTLRLQDDWEQFEYHFDKVHGDFLSRIRENYSELSPNEQRLAAFLRLNLNTKDIANLMGISVRGVEVARYRLRKKLDLVTTQNLSKFILNF